MDRELEYLIKAWKRVCKSLPNAEAVGAVTVEDAKTSVQKRLQEETLGARNCGISGSCVGREPTRNWKRQDSLVENCHKQWELLATHSGCGWMLCKSENCNSITNPELLFHTG